MSELTLREICNLCHVSRRAVQGYEKAGLVAATGRTDRGYLLYDEPAQKQIVLIRQFQEFGFHISEIKVTLSLPPQELQALLQEKRELLTAERDNIDTAICRITEWICALEKQSYISYK